MDEWGRAGTTQSLVPEAAETAARLNNSHWWEWWIRSGLFPQAFKIMK